MKAVAILLDILLAVPFVVFSAYLAFLTFLAAFQKLKVIANPSSGHRRFAVLVPAHDEESGIEKTVRSLMRIYYPGDCFDVIVIADNCTDRTAEIARAAGAEVFQRDENEMRGKGYALRWCLEKLLKSGREYDAFVIIDADSVASANFLTVMNYYLADGAECIQASDMVVPQPGVWSPEMTRVAFILHNYVRPLGRKAIGCGAGLNGNGMCFSSGLLKENPWNSFSRAEDLEHFLQLSLEGIRVVFAPEATVHAVMPSEAGNAGSQRKRWEMGRFPLIRKYTMPMLGQGLRRRSLLILDALVELLTPAFVNMFAVTVAAFCLNALLVLLGVAWLDGPTILWGVLVLLDLCHVVGGLKAAHADRGAYMALANLPRYAWWKLKLYAKTALNGDDRNWVRTARDAGENKTQV